MGETRKLAAILVADVVGYSRLAEADEDRTLARLRGLHSDLIGLNGSLSWARSVSGGRLSSREGRLELAVRDFGPEPCPRSRHAGGHLWLGRCDQDCQTIGSSPHCRLGLALSRCHVLNALADSKGAKCLI